MGDPTTFNLPAFLAWIAMGGGASAIVSWLCERWTWYQVQPADRKSLYMLLATAALAILAKVLVDYLPAEVIQVATPYIAILVSIVSVWATGQGFHLLQRKSTKIERPPHPGDTGSSATTQVAIDGDITRSNVITAGRDIKN